MIHQDSIDAIRIITSSGADIDVVIEFKKLDGFLGEYKTKITSATTTTIAIGIPTQVEIQAINLFNIDGSTSNDVTIQKYKTVAYNIIKKTLAAGESLNYVE